MTAAPPGPTEPAGPPSPGWLVLLLRLAERVVRDHAPEPDSERCAGCGEPWPCAALWLGKRGLWATRRATRRTDGGPAGDRRRGPA